MGLQIHKDNICTFFPLDLVSMGSLEVEAEVLVLVGALGSEVIVSVGPFGRELVLGWLNLVKVLVDLPESHQRN